jgi:hypothetical protein
MKKIMILAAVVAVSGIMNSCGGTKQVAQTTSTTQPSGADRIKALQDETALIKAQQELADAQAAATRAAKQREAEDARIDAQYKRAIDQAGKKAPIMEVQLIEIPCFNEALDTEPDQYITGFGIGEPGVNDSPYDQSLVYNNALVMARNTIGEKWMGFIKNISNNYYAKTTVPAGTQAAQANFERAVRTGGEKAINDFNAVLCQNMAKTERGTYVCYIASRVPMEKIKLQVAKELEILKVKYDQQVLFNTLDEELQKQAEKDKTEVTRELEQRRQLAPIQ